MAKGTLRRTLTRQVRPWPIGVRLASGADQQPSMMLSRPLSVLKTNCQTTRHHHRNRQRQKTTVEKKADARDFRFRKASDGADDNSRYHGTDGVSYGVDHGDE